MRILIVDDNLINQKMLQMVLTRLGYTHLGFAINGQIAVEQVQRGWQAEEARDDTKGAGSVVSSHPSAVASSSASKPSNRVGPSLIASSGGASPSFAFATFAGSYECVIMDITMDVMDDRRARPGHRLPCDAEARGVPWSAAIECSSSHTAGKSMRECERSTQIGEVRAKRPC